MAKIKYAINSLTLYLHLIIGQPLSTQEYEDLKRQLKQLNNNSIWGQAIQKADEQTFSLLTKSLAEQTLDNPEIMVKIVGLDLTVMLLRLAGELEKMDINFAVFELKK